MQDSVRSIQDKIDTQNTFTSVNSLYDSSIRYRSVFYFGAPYGTVFHLFMCELM
jgi:hypothetical protein